VPESVNIEAIRAYNPNFKRLGLLYNTNEDNSPLKQTEIAALSKEMGFDLVAVAPPLDTEGKPRIEGIAPKMAELKATGIDFVYLGSSPFLDVNRDAFTGAGVENSLPVLSSYKDLVRSSQALISVAARGYDIGRLAGAQAEKILVGGPPRAICR
jgi:putative ABC transport system substrate-binding protein